MGHTADMYWLDRGLCPEIVEMCTEDGPTTGRCGAPITDRQVGACKGHAAEIRQWKAMSESEKAQWERRRDEDGF